MSPVPPACHVQGEADAEKGHEADAAAYGERLQAFITHLRHDLSQFHPCLPVLLGVMPVRQRSYFPYMHQIRQHQLALEMPNVIKVRNGQQSQYCNQEAWAFMTMTGLWVCEWRSRWRWRRRRRWRRRWRWKWRWRWEHAVCACMHVCKHVCLCDACRP